MVCDPATDDVPAPYSVRGNGTIRFGLSCITGLKSAGDVIADEKTQNGSFTTLNDFLNRVQLKSNEYDALCLSGAMDCFSDSREELCQYVDEYTEARSAVLSCRAKLDEIASMTVATEKEAASQQKKVQDWTTKYESAQTALSNVVFSETYPTPNADKVMYEIKYLGTWASLSPLDDYEISDDYTVNHVKEVYEERDPGNAKRDEDKVTGIVSKFKEIETKKMEKMCVFDLIDKYGETIPCVVFPSNYDSDKNCCKGVIQNNQVVTISGLMQVNNRNDELQIIVDKCKQTKNMPQVLLLNGDYMLMAEALERIEPYRTQTDGIDISGDIGDQFDEGIKNFGRYTDDAMDILNDFESENPDFSIIDGR